MSNEKRWKIIAMDATDLFKAIELGTIKFNHDMPEGVKCINCKYDFKSNDIMFLIEHESFDPLYAGTIPPIYRMQPED